MSEQSDVTETAAEPVKSEHDLKKVPDDIGDILADTVKEPEEADHQAECHILNQGERNAEGGEMEGEGEGKEKGELDVAAESEEKDEQDGWLYVLGHNLLKKRVSTISRLLTTELTCMIINLSGTNQDEWHEG